MDRRSSLLLAAAIAWGIAVALLASRAWGRALDDFFITFRYAENLAHGGGFAFNPGETVFGTTAPGFAALLGVLRLITGIPVPGLGTLSTAVALWAMAMLVLAELRAAGRAAEGVAAGTLLALSPFVWPQHGSEIPVALLFLLLAARLAGRAPRLAAGLAALAIWCRPECAIGASALACSLTVRAVADGSDGRAPRRYVATLSGALLLAGAIDLATMGSLLPVTLAAKRAQSIWLPGVFVSGWGFWSHALRSIGEIGFGWGTPLALALGIAGAPVLLGRGGPACRMLVWQAAALAAAYPLLGVANYPWYAIPCVLAVSAGAPAAIGELARALARRTLPPRLGSSMARDPFHGGLRVAGSVIAGLVVLAPLAAATSDRLKQAWITVAPNTHYELYRRTGEWLRANTPPGATVAYVEVGTIGYFSERRVHDMLGLVTPRAIPFVPHGDMVGAFLAAPADYFLFNRNLWGFLDPVRRQPWFARAYRRVAHIDSAGGPFERVIVYARQPDSVLPPPRPPRRPNDPGPQHRPRHRPRGGGPANPAPGPVAPPAGRRTATP